jgi:pimeloyl-ACP methyl ester carboxylesterase
MFQQMKHRFRTGQTAGLILLAIFLICTLGCDSGTNPGGCNDPEPSSETLPIVFVHGAAGSADQFSLQAQRFASNGYPADLISGFEYDTTLANNTIAEIMTALDAHIDAVLAETGARQVNLAGHSMGTMMSQRYLASDRQRAAKVAHYVNIDGMTRGQLPGGVPTLAIWAAMTGSGRSITGATNVTLPSQTHVQSATSAEAFAEMYKFFTGKAPETVAVLPEAGATITLAGKMITFATNVIPKNYVVDIYEVNPATGMRVSTVPKFSQPIDAKGSFEFANVVAGKTYEVTTHSPATPGMAQHFYYEAPLRSDLLVRLKISEAGSTLSDLVDISAGQTNLTVVRDKELVGDAQSHPEQTLLKNDSLTVTGVELCTAASMPSSNATIGLYVFDADSDGQSNVSQSLPDFASVPFVKGVDLFLPASTPPQTTISVVLKGRQNGGLTQMIQVPNWSSATDKVTVQFRAF